jgi:DNA ligase-4
MVVFSDTENSILGFDKIRRHVSRAGTFIGAENDSPGQPGEHLMIILFDLLLLDDEDILSRSVEERKARLGCIYKRIHGRAAPAESCVLDFSQVNAERRLMNHFAASIACRHEGLVLKPCGVSYLSHDTVSGIKLKKDYIAGLGDEGDFAVVGASYSAQEARKRSDLRLKFTHFHLGCLTNNGALHQVGIKPVYRIVATIAYDHCMSTEILERVNIEGSLLAEPYSEHTSPFSLESDSLLRMEVCFRDPMVFEVLGSSYSKLPGGYFMLRHPRVRKLHQDRTWRDCITFSALQTAAAEALDSPQDSETQENVRWIAKLELSHKRRFARPSLDTTPRTSVADTTPRSAQSDSTCTPHTESASRIKPLAILGTGSRLEAIQHSNATPSKPASVLPTPPESSPLDRLGKPSAVLGKRKLSESRENGSRRPYLSRITTLPKQGRDKNIGENVESTPRTPLADITQQIARRSVESISVATRRSSWAEGHCKFGKIKPLASRERCILSQSVVFVAGLPEAEKEQVTRKVLEHGAVMIQNLSHWDRDSHTQPDTDCVCESQAYKGLRKMVLVDPRETSQYRVCYAEIVRLRLHRVEIFDYRLVEAMCSNAEAG